jgi:hypothetical protein
MIATEIKLHEIKTKNGVCDENANFGFSNKRTYLILPVCLPAERVLNRIVHLFVVTHVKTR